jgi:hypothetical protein
MGNGEFVCSPARQPHKQAKWIAGGTGGPRHPGCGGPFSFSEGNRFSFVPSSS